MTRTTTFLIAVGLACPVLSAGTHTADFGNSDSPNGLSRRAYLGVPGADQSAACAALSDPFEPYNHGTTDWIQQFWGGKYWLVNTNTVNFACADLGVGMGAEVLPGPLVAGGAFVTSPLSGMEPNFGPYALPFTFDVELSDYQELLDAGRYSGATLPPGFSATDFKSLGVTVAYDNQPFGTGTVRSQFTAGLRFDSGTSIPVLDIYDNQFGSLLPGGGIPFTQLPTTSQEWKMRVVVKQHVIELYVALDGLAFPSTPSAATHYAGYVPGPPIGITPLNALRIRAAALRIAGATTPTSGGTFQPIRVDRIDVTSSNINSFDGPPKVSPLPPTPAGPDKPFLRRVGADLFLDGAFGATGTNTPWLLDYFCGFDATADYGRAVIDGLVDSSEHRVIRFSCSGMFSTYVRDRSATFSGWPKVNYPMLELFESDPDAYFTAFDQLVDAATARGVYLVPSLLWGASLPYSYTHEEKVVDVDSAEIVGTFQSYPPMSEPIENAFVHDFITEIVDRYKDNPTVLFWEIGNEWDLKLNHSAFLAYPATASQPQWWGTVAELADSVGFVADQIRNTDTNHLIGTGYGGVADRIKNGALGIACDSGQPGCQSKEAMACGLEMLQPPSIDLICLHNYESDDPGSNANCTGWNPKPFNSWEDYYAWVREVTRGMYGGSGDTGRPFYVGEHNFKSFNSSIPCGDKPYLESVHRAMLTAMLGDPAAGVTPRAQLAMSWIWMPVPHARYIERHLSTPAILAKSFSAATDKEKPHLVFAEFGRERMASPKVLAAGFDGALLTIGSLSFDVVAFVADTQDDVVAVRVLDAAGVEVGTLSPDPCAPCTSGGSGDDAWLGDRWRGTISAAGAFASPGELFYQVEARDAGNRLSARTPLITVGTGGSSSPVAPGGPPLHPTLSARIHVAGYYGKDPSSADWDRLHVVAHVTDVNGAVIPPSELVLWGRVQDGTLNASQGWLGPLFQFVDDGLQGVSGDEEMGDGWYTSTLDVPHTTPLHATLQIEVVAVRLTSSGTVHFSSVWPWLKVH